MVNKRDAFILIAVGLIAYVILTNINAPVQTGNVNPVAPITPGNATAQETAPYEFRPDITWLIIGALVAYILWREKSGDSRKAYRDEDEAIDDLKRRLQAKDIHPVVVEQFRFTNPEDKIEFHGTFRCTNVAFPDVQKPITFEIRKNGSLTIDPARTFMKPLKPREKPRYIIKKGDSFFGTKSPQ